MSYSKGYRKFSDKEKAAYYKKLATQRAPAKRVYKKRAPARKAAVKRSRRTDGLAGGILGGTIGTAIGGPAGGVLGTAIGKGAHQLFKAITGFGDYSIGENTLLNGGMSPPQVINSTAQGGFIVRHREYLCDIDASVDWNLKAFPINPGMASTFPWLSQIAGSFEEYRMRGLVFEFKSLSSDAVLSTATSSALGSVIMATDYNVLGPTFNNKMEMENYEFANSSKPSCSFYHPVECKKSLTSVSELYIRTGAPPPNADQRLYDLGLFQISTIGMQAASGVAGELWCTYEVELYHPKYDADEQTIKTDLFQLQGTVADATPFGTVPALPSVNNNLGCTIDTSQNKIYLPPNLLPGTKLSVQYVLRLANGASAFAYTVPALVMNTQNINLVPLYGAGRFSTVPTGGEVTNATELVWVFNVEILKMTGPSIDSSIELAGGVLAADNVTGAQNVMISLIDDNVSHFIV